MACCLMTPSHHLNQCRLLICEQGSVVSPDSNSAASAQAVFCIMSLKIMLLKLLPHLPGANELNISEFNLNVMSVNPSCAEPGILGNNLFNTMPADALVP